MDSLDRLIERDKNTLLEDLEDTLYKTKEILEDTPNSIQDELYAISERLELLESQNNTLEGMLESIIAMLTNN